MKPDTKQQIGILVRAAREHAGFTQESLAAEIQRNKDTISLIERGKTFPTLRMLLEVAAALKVELSDLVPTAPATRSVKRLKLEAEIRELVRGLPDHRLEYVKDQITLAAKLR